MKSAFITVLQSLVPDNGEGVDGHRYEQLPSNNNTNEPPPQPSFRQYCHHSVDVATHAHLGNHSRTLGRQKKRRELGIIMGIIGLSSLFYWAISRESRPTSCDTVQHGFICAPKIAQYWGQYSPYFSVESDIPTEVTAECQITFVQVLARHGARDPTSKKTAMYSALIDQIHTSATSYSKEYTFIRDFNYTIGADQLSVFGQQQMVNSGYKFYQRYKMLTRSATPFVRAAGQDRVVESAQNFTQGFHDARMRDHDSTTNASYPYPIIRISEDMGQNNTLSHGLCTVFEASTVGGSAQDEWMDIFTPLITARLNKNLPGVNLTKSDTINFMDICPFDTVSNSYGKVSAFCSLFTEKEWREYDYYQSLGKYYGYGYGNPLGSTQGVGFTNELIARMTDSPVHDHTSTNSSLDSDPAKFPVGGSAILYADFSHDNDMTGIFSALGLYNSTAPLLNTTVETTEATKGYSAAWTVPFAARAYFEKMSCVGEAEELVRVVVNDRVIPMESCGGDELGRCRLSRFVDSLNFAKAGGYWDQCFV